jgi:hypothetical protein
VTCRMPTYPGSLVNGGYGEGESVADRPTPVSQLLELALQKQPFNSEALLYFNVRGCEPIGSGATLMAASRTRAGTRG